MKWFIVGVNPCVKNEWFLTSGAESRVLISLTDVN